MPLPKKLKKGASKKKKQEVISETMHDLKHGPHHKDRTRKQEIAIAEKQAGNSRKGGKKIPPSATARNADKPRPKAKRKLRNKGRG